MNFDDIQNVWNSNADSKNQPDLSEQEIKSLLAKKIEAEKLHARKKHILKLIRTRTLDAQVNRLNHCAIGTMCE